jgi:predicted DNA-binding protein with PD1-like motif
MAVIRPVEGKQRLMGKLSFGADLLGELTEICQTYGVTLGRLEAIGAVQSARVAYYNQTTRTYEPVEFNKPHEILKLAGNISLKDGKPIVHAHLTLSDSEGRACGGHLSPGTIVFACEYLIESFDGEPFERGFDEETGLPLWKCD